jgi:UDP-3-O-[3-hydroxymyristoyl] glucosamine N-acyltransferase
MTIGSFTLGELAQRLGCTLHGDADLAITGVAGMEHATASELTFLANPKYAPKVKQTQAAAILVTEPVKDHAIASLVSRNPYHDFARALEMFYQPPRPEAGIHPMAFVDPTTVIGDGASIGPFAAVGPRVKIGRGCVLYPHVVIYEGVEIGDDFLAHSHSVVREFCRIGDRVILQNGTVVGGDGFGFAKTAEGTHFKIVQAGVVVIEDDVEIQSLTAVDRATVGETRVKRGAKIDNLVQVGHASVIGEDDIVCAQVGLAGSSVLGKNVLLAGQVGLSGHQKIGDNTVVYAQSGVGGDIPAGSVISGSPAFDAKIWLRAAMSFQKLPDVFRTMRQLERRVAELESTLRSQEEKSAHE